MPIPPDMTADALIDEAIELLLQGLPYQKIKKYLMQTRGSTDAEALRIVQNARDAIRAAAQYDREEEVGKAKTRLENLYYRLHKNKDYKNCLACQRELTDLIGLRNITVKNLNANVNDLPPEERARVLKEWGLMQEDMKKE